MKRNIRIVSTITTMLLVIAIMCVGIFAATQINVTGNGTLTFSAEDVYATVTVEHQAEGEGVSEGVKTWTFDKDTDPGIEMTAPLNFADIAVDKATRTATVTVTVQNDFGADTGIKISAALVVTSNEEFVTVSGTETATVSAGEENKKTFTVTFTLTDKAIEEGLGADGVDFDFSLTLTRATA